MKNLSIFLLILKLSLVVNTVSAQVASKNILDIQNLKGLYIKANTNLYVGGLILKPTTSKTITDTNILLRTPANSLVGHTLLKSSYSFSKLWENFEGTLKIQYNEDQAVGVLKERLKLLSYGERRLTKDFEATTHDQVNYLFSKTLTETIDLGELTLGYQLDGLPSLDNSVLSLSKDSLFVNHPNDSVQIRLSILDINNNPVETSEYRVFFRLISGMNPGDPGIRYAGNGFYIGSIRNVSSTGSTTIGFSIDGNPSAQHVVLRYVPIPSIPPDPKPETEETDNNNSDNSGNSGFGGEVVPKEPEPPIDSDADGIPDSEDPDDDNDGWLDIQEYNCECACSVNTKKSEAVPLSDPLDPNSVPLDSDGDNIADCVDTDDDNDGVNDENDAFPLDPSEWTDTDGDGIGNNADLDDDNDSWSDFDELSCGANPLNIFNSPSDIDQDGIADCVDSDRDGDGYLNTNDFFPDNSKEWSDADADGLGDNLDVDDDNDGILDSTDAFPLDPSEWIDTDGDGIGDNEDLDDNNDGFNDIDLLPSGLLTPNCNCSESVWRVVNIENHPTSRVRVYNKSGHEVFSASGYKNDWEGTYNNKPLPAGSYYYIISLNNGTPAKEGWLYLTY